MNDDVFAGLPPTGSDRWLVSLAPFEDVPGRHLRLAIECRLAETNWRARARRALTAIGMGRAAQRVPMRVRIDIELFAVQSISGDLVNHAGEPADGLFAPRPPRVLLLELESTPAQGAVYYLLRLRTDKGAAEFPSLEAIVRWQLLPA